MGNSAGGRRAACRPAGRGSGHDRPAIGPLTGLEDLVGDGGEELPTDAIGLVAQRSDDNNRYWLKYWDDDDATSQVLRGQWACTGDLVRRDKDGHFWFEGRSDDIIKSSGYRIGPFEIESAILKHADVLEAAVVGVPDPLHPANTFKPSGRGMFLMRAFMDHVVFADGGREVQMRKRQAQGR